MPGTRSMRLFAGVAITAVLTGWSWVALEAARSGADPVSPASSMLSLKGELRAQGRALTENARRALVRHDTVLAWVYEPVVRGLLGKGHPLSRALAAVETSEKPAVLARGGPDAERRFADELAAIGEPLVGALIGHVSDVKVELDTRCVLIRTLGVHWPERLGRELATVLAHESYAGMVGEAAVEAGRINARLPPPGLVPDLRAAVARLSGWGRQYAILALVMAEDRESVALVRTALEDREVAVRRHAALYLAASGDMSNMGLLRELARRDPDATTRMVAAVALSRLIGVVLPPFAATDAEVRKAFRNGAPHLPQPEVEIRQIVMHGTSDAVLARLRGARRRIAGGEPFEAVARAVSEDRGITRLGRVSPPLTRARMTPDLWRTVEALAPGQISGPVRGPGSVHLVTLVRRLPVHAPSFDEMSAQLAERIVEKKRLEFVENAMLPRMAMFRGAVHE